MYTFIYLYISKVLLKLSETCNVEAVSTRMVQKTLWVLNMVQMHQIKSRVIIQYIPMFTLKALSIGIAVCKVTAPVEPCAKPYTNTLQCKRITIHFTIYYSSQCILHNCILFKAWGTTESLSASPH